MFIFLRAQRRSGCALRARRLVLEKLENRQLLAAAFAEFVDPHPGEGHLFGSSVVPLPTGNVVITAPFDDAGGPNAGAVYLFSGATGKLLSTLIGSHPGDEVGSGGVTELASGNYVISSPFWSGDAGAVTFASGTTGVSGVVSEANSLVGQSPEDFVGNGSNIGQGVRKLPNGNYVVVSPGWSDAGAAHVGAVTFGSGITGVSGAISAANSQVGSTAGDRVGSAGITILSNSNYVVSSPLWDRAGISNAGAVTFASGATGLVGTVSEANSLVGSSPNDNVGGLKGQNSAFVFYRNSVTALASGNYVVSSPTWDNGQVADAGAVTFGSGVAGVNGAISAANSLVGSTANDQVGGGISMTPEGFLTFSRVFPLTNGNYVVASPYWDSASVVDAGAATLGDGKTGVVGNVSEANSLFGTTSGDLVGAVIWPLPNGNYVVSSTSWSNGAADNAGAVTFASGSTGIVGPVSAANSLVGTTDNDWIGQAVTVLANGNYVVTSPYWDNGAVADVGAATFGSGTAGVSGVISESNSLIGSQKDDRVGQGYVGRYVTPLANGNYVVSSGNWHNGSVEYAGAVTWGDGTSGTHGVVGANNSLVGTSFGDEVGSDGIAALPSGNFVVLSSGWDNGEDADVGAATFGSGTSGISGALSTQNSLVGTSPGDLAAGGGLILSDGSFLVSSPNWANGDEIAAGALTRVDGISGLVGTISAGNSLIGKEADFELGRGFAGLAPASSVAGLAEFSGGRFAVLSPLDSVGDVYVGGGDLPTTGIVNEINSLFGTQAFDDVGSGGVTEVPGGYVVMSPVWDNAALVDAGAMTFYTANGGGAITGLNSVFGATANAQLQPDVVLDNVNQQFYGRFLFEGGGHVRAGSQIDGFAHHWHLAARPNDVNNDGHMSAGDALAVINYVNAGFASAVPAAAPVGTPYGFVDVNGDDFVAANDALDVINAINAGQGGEGEADGGSGVGSQESGDWSQETGDRQAGDALMMLLAMDLSAQVGRRRV